MIIAVIWWVLVVSLVVKVLDCKLSHPTYLSTQWTCSCTIVFFFAGLPVVIAVHMSTGEVHPGLASCIKVLGKVCVCVCVCVCVSMCTQVL